MSKSTSHVVYPSDKARCEELEPAVIQWTLTKSLCVTLPKRLLLCVSGTGTSVWSGLRSASQSQTPSGTTRKEAQVPEHPRKYTKRLSGQMEGLACRLGSMLEQGPHDCMPRRDVNISKETRRGQHSKPEGQLCRSQ